MTASLWNASGIILAGGRSRRMGRNKVQLTWGTETLLSRISSVLQQVLHEVWVIGDEPASSNEPDASNIHRIMDDPRIGPLGAILTGLKSIDSQVALISACDMPFVSIEAIQRLWSLYDGASVTILRTTDGLHPLFGWYRTDCIPVINDHIRRGENRVSGFFSEVNVSVIDVSDDSFWMKTLFNINTHQDYCVAQQMDSVSGNPVAINIIKSTD